MHSVGPYTSSLCPSLHCSGPQAALWAPLPCVPTGLSKWEVLGEPWQVGAECGGSFHVLLPSLLGQHWLVASLHLKCHFLLSGSLPVATWFCGASFPALQTEQQ